MSNDGLSSDTTTSATTPKDQIRLLKAVQQRLWAIMGLKMAVDRLKSLGYDVVAQCTPDGSATITVQLKVHLDFESGNVNGKDILASQDEVKAQIELLEAKDEAKK